MDRIRLLVIGTVLMFVMTAVAQQSSTGSEGNEKQSQDSAQGAVPTPEEQLKVLTLKLDLTSDQVDKMKPILQQMHNGTQKIMDDKSLTREEQLARVRPLRYNARDQMLEILNDEQKKKLDEYLHGPHREMHGNLSGSTSQQPQH
jgi:Spy/CpxP family protein refolding chaperone